jgi:RND family efflux transporter MFP subunit
MDAKKVSKLQITDKERNVGGGQGKWRPVWVVLFLVGTAAAAYGLYERGLLTPAESVHVTSVGWVYPSQVITQFNASGYVVAQRRASVASKATGRLQYLAVKEGSRVKEGEVLARLESDDLEAEKAQVEAQLAAMRADLVRADTELRAAERNLRRFQNLWERRVTSQSDFENSEDQFKRAKAQVESAKGNIRALEAALRRSSIAIEYTLIRAPFDGVVLTKNADMGEIVAPFASAINAKAAVVTMADMSSLMVEADVAESFLSKVREDQPCEIQLDALPDVRFTGSVNTIVPTADRTRGTVLVKVNFDLLDPRILPEMSARVAFLSRPLSHEETRPFLAVHRSALAQRNGAHGIFKIEDDRARWIGVDRQAFVGDYLPLGDPWQPGEKIVLNPSLELRSGGKVKAAETQ